MYKGIETMDAVFLPFYCFKFLLHILIVLINCLLIIITYKI